MAHVKSRADFATTDIGKKIRRQLEDMVSDSAYNTVSSYSANSSLYPDNTITFTDKHMNYLICHPKLDPEIYLTNVRLQTRVR